jgi:hypothetical protein
VAAVLGVATALYVVLLLAQMPDLLWVTGWNPDAVISWVLAEDLGAPPRDVVEGSYGFYPITWFALATQGLPGHRLLWQLQPLATALATGALVAWGVWRVAGARAAGLSAVILVCASPAVLATALRPTFHGPAFFAVALLSAYVVELGRAPPFGGPRGLAAASAAVAVVVGVNLVDGLLWVAGVAPFAVAVAALRRRDAAIAGAAVVAGAVLVRTVAVAAMHAAGFAWVAPTTTALTLDAPTVRGHVESLGSLVFALGNGALELSTAGPWRGTLSLACAAVATAGIAAPVALLVRRLATRTRRPSPMLVAHLTFWSAVVVALLLAGLFTSVIVDQESTRYVVPLALAAAATAPLLLDAGRVARAVALAGTATFVAGSLVGLLDRDLADPAAPARGFVTRLERAATASGATTGFGEYYVASNVTWQTRGRVVSRPVEGIADLGVCPHHLARSLAWYRPTGARRTFLLWPTTTPAPPNLGRPVRSYALGSDGFRTVTMHVYAGDVARRLCRPSGAYTR